MKSNRRHVLILILLTYVFFMMGNGIVSLTNPDEVFYAQTTREMIQHKTWSTPYLFGQPQFEKPILLYWLMRISMAVFPNLNFAARFAPALFACLGVIVLYFLTLLGFKNERKAYLASGILMSGGLYIGMARTVFTDMIFSVLILCALGAFYWGYSCKERKGAGIILFFISMALAVLAKGPLGFLIPFLIVAVFLVIKKDLRFLFSIYSFWGVFLCAAIAVPWYALMMKLYGHTFIREFFYNDHVRRLLQSEHRENDTWYFYPLSMISGMLPWSLCAAAALFFFLRRLKASVSQMDIFLVCWIGVVFMIFQVAHSKLGSYILPLFPALAMVTGDFVDTRMQIKGDRVLFGALLITVLLLMLLPAGFIFALYKFPGYLSSKVPVYVFTVCLALFLGKMLFCVLKRKLLRAVYLLGFLVLLFLFLIPFIYRDVESYFSSKAACEYLLKNYTVNSTILCSKMYVRGVRCYTDKDVAVVDIPGRNLFSPHPIPFLNSDQAVGEFLKKQPQTYCIIRKSAVDDIERIAGSNRKFSILKAFGDEYIVKIESSQ